MTSDQRLPRPEGDDVPAARARRGFALPLAILCIAVLTITLAASFASTGTEILTNNAQRSESRAFAIAENGLQEFIAMRGQRTVNSTSWCTYCGSPPTVKVESTTVTFTNGYAKVVAQRVMRNVGITRPAVYLLISRGVDTVTPLNGASIGTRAERVVAQYAYWDMKVINIVSGWTSLSGLAVKGSAGTISGVDKCGKNGTLAGVAVPNGAYTQTGNGGVAVGTPPVTDLGTAAQASATVNIDWPNIINETAITPNLSLAGGSTIPSSTFADTTYWPVIHVRGDANVPSGRGLLIVDGNATFGGSGTWRGIILVGGNLTSNGANDVFGAVITGLNIKLGQAVTQDDAGNGNKFYEYDSCSVAAATAGIGHYRLFPNAWMDNFSTY